jgi:hypothetical protein
MADTIVIPLANALLTCLQTQVSANPNPVAEYCLRTGPTVIHDVDGNTGLDKVCCPGLGYVRVGRVYPSTDFPEPDPRNDKCMSLARSLELTVGVVRCVPGMGTPEGPTCAEWTATAINDANDLDALFRAVCCWVAGTEFKKVRGRRYAIQESIVDQSADCIERSMQILVELPKCC